MKYTITLPRAVLEQAIKALDINWDGCANTPEGEALEALHEALDQTQSEYALQASTLLGWRLVPVEPTEAMIDAAFSISPDADVAYKRMLATAPQPPAAHRARC